MPMTTLPSPLVSVSIASPPPAVVVSLPASVLSVDAAVVSLDASVVAAAAVVSEPLSSSPPQAAANMVSATRLAAIGVILFMSGVSPLEALND
jgi:hypothetical protein